MLLTKNILRQTQMYSIGVATYLLIIINGLLLFPTSNCAIFPFLCIANRMQCAIGSRSGYFGLLCANY